MPQTAAMQDRLQQTTTQAWYLKRCCASETVENQRLHRSYKKMTIYSWQRTFSGPEEVPSS
jgi:hypothetical protein